MQITVMPRTQHYEISVLKLWLTRKFGLLGSTAHTTAIQSKTTWSFLSLVDVLGERCYFFSIWHESLSSKNLSQAGWAVMGCLSLGIHQSAGERHANIPDVSSLQDTTKCHHLWPHLPESFSAIWVLLPRMSSTVINNGFDLNWLLWSLKCLKVC